MYGGYVGGEIIFASTPKVIGAPGDDNEVFVFSSGPSESGEGGYSSQEMS